MAEGKRTQRDLIVSAFNGTSATAREIAVRLSLPFSTVYAQCHSLHKLGRLANVGTLPAQGHKRVGSGRAAIVWEPVISVGNNRVVVA